MSACVLVEELPGRFRPRLLDRRRQPGGRAASVEPGGRTARNRQQPPPLLKRHSAQPLKLVLLDFFRLARHANRRPAARARRWE